MKRITNYDGIYGERNTSYSSEYIFSEQIQTRSKGFDWKISPHVHARLFQVFFIESGTFEFVENSRTQSITGPCLVLLPPLTLHGFTFNASITGRILTLSENITEGLFPDGEPVSRILLSPLHLSSFNEPYDKEYLIAHLNLITEEIFGNRPERKLMIRTYLQQLFLIVYRLTQTHLETAPEQDNASLHYFASFKKLIRKGGLQQNVSQMAATLGISSVHLNRICNVVAGKPASEVLQDYIIEEAKKYLKHTSYPVAEIAYQLHFDYPNYFARFFKKHTGLSPREFREGKEMAD